MFHSGRAFSWRKGRGYSSTPSRGGSATTDQMWTVTRRYHWTNRCLKHHKVREGRNETRGLQILRFSERGPEPADCYPRKSTCLLRPTNHNEVPLFLKKTNNNNAL